jgi:hypothetical protein
MMIQDSKDSHAGTIEEKGMKEESEKRGGFQ